MQLYQYFVGFSVRREYTNFQKYLSVTFTFVFIILFLIKRIISIGKFPFLYPTLYLLLLLLSSLLSFFKYYTLIRSRMSTVTLTLRKYSSKRLQYLQYSMSLSDYYNYVK